MIIYLRGAVADWVRELAWTGDLTIAGGSNPFYPALPVYFGHGRRSCDYEKNRRSF